MNEDNTFEALKRISLDEMENEITCIDRQDELVARLRRIPFEEMCDLWISDSPMNLARLDLVLIDAYFRRYGWTAREWIFWHPPGVANQTQHQIFLMLRLGKE
jgi:hypothetical protein